MVYSNYVHITKHICFYNLNLYPNNLEKQVKNRSYIKIDIIIIQLEYDQKASQ